jgi:hypothetical protein
MAMLRSIGIAEWTAIILATVITLLPLAPYGV